jgi:CRISPR/Cas system-associated exonuclease Cas4 (RecB family)
MKYNEILKPDFLDLNFEIKAHVTPGDKIERREEHSKQLTILFLEKNTCRSLSPSAINMWLNCRMKFFYRYVNGLKEVDNITADIDPAMLGNILHDIMKNLYQPYLGAILTTEFLNGLIQNKKFLLKLIDDSVNEKYKAGRTDSISGNELIVRDVLMAYLLRVLNTDKAFAPIMVLNLENSFSFNLSVHPNESQIEIIAGGMIDRIDTVNGVTRVVDYKTGSVSDFINSADDLFVDDRKKDSDGWLQTLLYCEAFLSFKPGSIVRPSVYKIKKMNIASTGDRLRLKTGSRSETYIDNYTDIREQFIIGLKGLITTIFSNDEPFTKTTDIRGKCSFCPYRALCMR